SPTWSESFLRRAIRVLHQSGRTDRAGPESPGDLVDRLLRFSPADRPIIERQLGICAGRRHETRHPDADQTQLRTTVETGRLIERARCGINLMRDIGRIGERPGPGHRLEAGEPDLDRNRPRHAPAGPQAARGPPGELEQLAPDPLRVVDVGGERLLGPDALLGDVGRDPALVPAPRQRGQVRPLRYAELMLQGGQRGLRDVAHRAATGSGCRKSSTPSRGTTSIPSGLQRAEAILAMNLAGATPTEQVMPCCLATWARMCLAIPAGAPRRRRAPATSRKASSSASGSTSGVTAPKMAMTSLDTAAYTWCLGATNTARGHIRWARLTGIAERTPKARA